MIFVVLGILWIAVLALVLGLCAAAAEGDRALAAERRRFARTR